MHNFKVQLIFSDFSHFKISIAILIQNQMFEDDNKEAFINRHPIFDLPIQVTAAHGGDIDPSTFTQEFLTLECKDDYLLSEKMVSGRIPSAQTIFW